MCDLIFLRFHAASDWYQSKVSSCKMFSGKVVDGGRIPGGDQNMEVHRADQPVPRAMVDAMDQRLRRVEQLVETLVSRFDAMEVGTNRVRIDEGGRPRA